ncbi:unnamed protein product [Cylindrotheca closterium]|uniref:Uncharacterized protein n=1 Tax=Cylindrotheca closterium TaxID=2856 RepID=A0AAD2FG32_9STRA|nr:unnamed protein product [Cylindrotheca closterium]
MCWDNFQKFIPIKFLKFGMSVTDTHCTVRYAYNVNVPEAFVATLQQKLPEALIYLDQRIPAPPGMFPFECLEELDDDQQNEMIELLISSEQENHSVLLNVFAEKAGHPFVEDNNLSNLGKRVIRYQKVLKIARALCDMKRFLVSYEPEATDDLILIDDNASKNADGSTSAGNENDANDVVRAIRANRKLCEKANTFQKQTVASWNKFEANVTKIFPLLYVHQPTKRAALNGMATFL